MRAQELANDLAHALEVVEAERDEAIRERDEAQAVIDAVVNVRDVVATAALLGASLPGQEQRTEALRMVTAMLDTVDGL